MRASRLAAALVLFATLVIVVGCKKSSTTDPDPNSDPGSGTSNFMTKADARKYLAQVGLAIHAYADATGQLPAGIVGPKGQVGLSWRVQILPYFEDGEAGKLFKEFKLNEPWDSATNKPLVAKMPKAFASPGKAAAEGKTHLRSFIGEAAIIRYPFTGFASPKDKTPQPPFAHLQPGSAVPGRRFTDLTDGTSNTLMVAEAPDAVEWTKPDELRYNALPGDPTQPAPPKLGGPFAGGFYGLMCDGSVLFFPEKTRPDKIAAMITVNGGEVIDATSDILTPPDPKKEAIGSGVPGDSPNAAARKMAVAYAQEVVRGMYGFERQNGFFPAGIAANKAPGLSWRVQILPFLGQEPLYKQFKLDEPWDSEHNKKLIELMPYFFASAWKPAENGHTFIRTTQGPGGMIRSRPGPKGSWVVDVPANVESGKPIPGRKVSDLLDGISITILFAEAGEAVPWTKPDELYLDAPPAPKSLPGPAPKPAKLPPLGGAFEDGFHAMFADGVIVFYKTGYPADDLARLFSPMDGWVVDRRGDPDKIWYTVPSALEKR